MLPEKKYISLFLFIFITAAVFSGETAPGNEHKVNVATKNFIENKGQVIDMDNNLRPDILFYGSMNNATVYLRKGGISYVTNNLSEADANDLPDVIQFDRIDMDFVGANPQPVVEVSEMAAGYFNYYYPHCRDGITKVNSYNKVVYRNIYRNIDIVFYSSNKGLKYDIVVLPGGDPADVRFKYKGAVNVTAGKEDIIIANSFGMEMKEEMPKVYQNINGKINNVNAAYVLNGEELSFSFSEFNKKFPLVIDPWVTYYGGAQNEITGSITADAAGNSIITGHTFSANFPVTPGAFQTSQSGATFDAFVVKFNSSGSPVFATFIGGTANDYGQGIITDAGGNICVAGYTHSGNFPVGASGANVVHQPAHGAAGGYDAFLFTLDPAGSRLWATFYGSTGKDDGWDVASDGTNFFLYGETTSVNAIATAGVFQTSLNGGTNADVFVAKFAPNGGRLWATYVGGSGIEQCGGIDIDGAGNIFIGGATLSSDFPVFAGHQMVYAGVSYDAFVFKFNSAGVRQWATYYGAVQEDKGFAITADALGDVVIGGWTKSTTVISTAGAYQAALAGGEDAFIVKFDATGTRLWGTYLGGAVNGGNGSNSDYCTSLAHDSNNNIIAFGDTYSSSFPVTSCAHQTSFIGQENQWLATFRPNGELVCTGYFGDNSLTTHNETDPKKGGCIAVSGNNLFITAYSRCTYQTTANAHQPSCGGGTDAVIAKICVTSCGFSNTTADFSADTTNVCPSSPVNFSLTRNTVSCDTAVTTYLWDFQGAAQSTSTLKDPSGIIWNNPGTYSVSVKVMSTCDTIIIAKTNYITVYPFPSPVISGNNPVCTGNAVSVTASGAAAYSWSNGSTGAFVSFSPSSSTNYTLTSVSINGCTKDTVINIIINQLPVIAVTGDTSLCPGNSSVLTASGASTYLWSPGGGLNTTTGNIVTASPSGSQSYTVTGTDGNGCSGSVQINITVSASLPVSLSSNTSICEGDSVILSAGGGTIYTWSNGSTSQNITVSPTSNSIYTVTVANSSGCSKDTSVNVTVNAAPLADAGPDDTICVGNSVILNASGGNSFLWNTGQTTQSISNTPALSGIYSVTVSNGNCNDVDSVSITVVPNPTVNIGNDTTLLAGFSITINASGGLYYLWNTGETTASILHQPTQTTVYIVIVTDAEGCTSTDTITVIVEDNCIDTEVFVPNSFSPNGDGQNDELKLFSSGYVESVYFVIYDRWGEKIFETTNMTDFWNGIYKSRYCDSGVYVYLLKYSCSAVSKEIEGRGNISLMR